MLLILSCLTSCPGDSVESSTRLIHHVIRLMHALLILRASMRVRTHRDGNVHGGVQQAGRSRWARLGCIVLTNTTSPQCLRNPQGREGGTQQQQHDRAHETRERILEAFSKHSVRNALNVHHEARYGNMGGICMHARPDRKVSSPAGALIHT